MKLYIRNMVCNRCKMAVENELEKAGLAAQHVDLGEVTLKTTLAKPQLNHLREGLKALGFELIDDQKSRLIEQIKRRLLNWCITVRIRKP